MLKKLLISFCYVMTACCCYSTAFAKDSMLPPPPANNKVFDSMVGTWKGVSNMRGTQMNEVLTISWSINHQFLMLKLMAQAADNPSNHYEGLGMFGFDNNGNVMTWWFDSWGAPAVSVGTGTTQNNQFVLNDSNSMFKEQRTFQINGNQMTVHGKGSMTLDGKVIPIDKTVTYTR